MKGGSWLLLRGHRLYDAPLPSSFSTLSDCSNCRGWGFGEQQERTVILKVVRCQLLEKVSGRGVTHVRHLPRRLSHCVLPASHYGARTEVVCGCVKLAVCCCCCYCGNRNSERARGPAPPMLSIGTEP